MVIKFKKIYFSSLSNVGRNFINPILITFVSYLFIKTQARHELLEINKINAILNLFIVFSGWGLKDYLLKENFKSLATFPQKWNEALYSKLPLLLISLMAALLLPMEYSCIIFGFVILRTVNTLYDSLIIYNKKVSLFFLFDALAALLVVLLIWFRIVNNHKTYFLYFAGSGIFKVVFKPLFIQNDKTGLF